MLYEAAYWNPERPRPPKEEFSSEEPKLARYLEGWGRPGDDAVVALDLSSGRRLGAVWYRLMTSEEPGYGFVDDSTPEIALAILPDHRGRGMGGALLREIRHVARSRGYGALSLSVEHGNPALRLYERSGFVKLFETEDAWTMKADLSAGEA
jgi:ribosomal protein S18 acetylase RimI-like enzyme